MEEGEGLRRETTQLKLPLLQASQAQKHVTVNAALMRLDGLAQLRLQQNRSDEARALLNAVCSARPESGGAVAEAANALLAQLDEGG